MRPYKPRTFKPKTCVCPCHRVFAPSGPRQVYATPDCARQVAHDQRSGLYEAERTGELTSPMAGALALTVLALRSRAVRFDLSLPGLGQIVRNVVAGHRQKDRTVYAEALAELAGWALTELARVRPGDDATPS